MIRVCFNDDDKLFIVGDMQLINQYNFKFWQSQKNGFGRNWLSGKVASVNHPLV